VENKYITKGNQLHKYDSLFAKSFDRRILVYKIQVLLGKSTIIPLDKITVSRVVNNIEVRGRLDNFRVLLNIKNGVLVGKVVSFYELKTTSKPYVSREMIDSARLQLQLYLWLFRPILEKLDYKMHSRHYIEFRSQDGNRLMMRVSVKEDPMMGEHICDIIASWEGLKPSHYPNPRKCKSCHADRLKCSMFVNRFPEIAEKLEEARKVLGIYY
jgi:hypothetical protein